MGSACRGRGDLITYDLVSGSTFDRLFITLRHLEFVLKKMFYTFLIDLTSLFYTDSNCHLHIYYPQEASSMTYCCLGMFRKEYFRFVTN